MEIRLNVIVTNGSSDLEDQYTCYKSYPSAPMPRAGDFVSGIAPDDPCELEVENVSINYDCDYCSVQLNKRILKNWTKVQVVDYVKGMMSSNGWKCSRLGS